MRQWGKSSKRHLDTVDRALQRVMNRVLQEVADVSITCGYRDEATQNLLYIEGKSKVIYPNSKHNIQPSRAIDFLPYPAPTSEKKLWAALGYIAGRAIEIGKEEGVVLRWGGDWNRNGDLTDNNFDDLFHLEIVEFISANEDTDGN